jgi:hypothetical protein
MSELISKKYVKSTPSGATPSNTILAGRDEHVEAILSAPTTLTSTTTDVVKESTVLSTLELSMRSITDVITLLDSLPRVGGKLPDKVILALGKLQGALNLLRK